MALQVCDNVEKKGLYDVHVDARLKNSIKVFDTLQSGLFDTLQSGLFDTLQSGLFDTLQSGLYSQGLDWETAIYLFNTCCRSLMTYACDTMYLSKANNGSG